VVTAYPFGKEKNQKGVSAVTTGEKFIRSKMNLLDLAVYLKNVSEACRVIGYSRDTFYRVKRVYEEGGLECQVS